MFFHTDRFLPLIVASLAWFAAVPAAADSIVVFNEIHYHPATNEATMEWVELYNQNAVDVDLSGWFFSSGIEYTFPQGTIISGGGYVVVAASPTSLAAQGVDNALGPFAGRLDNGGEELQLRDVGNRIMDSVSYGDDNRWPVGPDGAGVTLAKRHPDLGSDTPENWTLSATSGGSPGSLNFPTFEESVVIVSTNITILPLGSSWRYFQGGDPGAGWAAPGFNDSAWATGTALLGVEDAPLPFPLFTPLTLGEAAYYFRTTFNVSGDPAEKTLNLTHVLDDGGVFYINGVEVLRTGMPNGVVTHGTFSDRTISDASLEGPFPVSTADLVPGVNTLAVEVHQRALDSSDIVLGVELNEFTVLEVVTNRPTAAPMTGATTQLVALDSVWRFEDSGVDQGTAWRNLAFNDVAWGSGPGLFFVEDAVLPGPKNTSLVPDRNTYYFRTLIPLTEDPFTSLFSLRPMVDDGAVFYLNGKEVGRVNMPVGPVAYGTMAAGTVGNADFLPPLNIASSNLVVGQNILAVELHQSTATTNAGLRVISVSGYSASWDGSDGDFFSPATPAPAPDHDGLASRGVDVFPSSNPELVSSVNDGFYGAAGAWSPAPGDLVPVLVFRFNDTIPISSIAWSRDNGDATEPDCGGTCTNGALGNYTFQYTLAPDPSTITFSSSNPTNGWVTIATVQHLSHQLGFTPHLRHRFAFSKTDATPILATGLRFRPPPGSVLDEVEINTPSLATFDAVFGLEFSATEILPPPPKLVFNEISQASDTDFWIEIFNADDQPASLEGIRVVRNPGDVSYDFPGGMLPVGARLVVTQAELGFGAAPADKLFLFAAGGFSYVDGVTVRATPRGRFPDGIGAWLTPTSSTPGAPNVVQIQDGIVINEIMYHHPPIDPSPAVTTNLSVVTVLDSWRYEDSGVDLGTSWRESGYNDAAWSVGNGLFANNASGLPAPVNTSLAPDQSTYYFRTTFNYTGSASNLTLDLRAVIDDGAVFYLNGTEIHRQGMPQGPITHGTSASVAVGDASFVETLSLPSANLVQGNNVLAVEVHQATSGSGSSGIQLTGGGLALVEEGPFGGVPPLNLARLPGVTPFAIDSLSGFPIHHISNLNAGDYGNSASWIGNSGNPGYCGLNFGQLFEINSIAFGRDNLGDFTDRTLGLYTLQYTQVASPGTATSNTGNPATGWATIGTLNYQSAGSGLFTSPSRRHRFTFNAVQATGIRLLVPGTGIGGGTCIDELEVNPPDTSGDIAFGVQLDLTTTLVPAQAFAESDEEWVEIFNRGSNVVELSGWALDGTVDYLFPPGVFLLPGEYLVLARDSVALRAKWPEFTGRILGDVLGRMSETDQLVLRDDHGNPVDRVMIHEVGFSDGAGSSLELVDPFADNANAGVWRASDESGRSEWQTVTYRMIAGQAYGSSLWNEFRLGMLDAGEVVVDDVRVVRDPDGLGQDLIQNGNFETTTGNTHWRLLGSHQDSAIISDPDDAGNHVLKIVSTAPARTSHNHVETSYAGNTPLLDGQWYEVSFRARWLAGTPLLHSSSYQQRLARANILRTPSRMGTPAARNSTWVDNAGPTFTGLSHSPVVPAINEPVTISVHAADPEGVTSATLFYRLNPAPTFTSLPMTTGPNGQWQAGIPGAASGQVVQFYVAAMDGLGAMAFAPQAGPDSRALYQVVDTQGVDLPAHELRLIQLNVDRDFMHRSTNVMSQTRMGATVIYNGSEVFYDAAVRLKGSAAGRIRDGDAFVGYDIRFPVDHLFRGVQRSVGIDRSGRAPVVRQQHEIYILHMFQQAGLPVHHTDLCHFISPKTVHTGTAILQLGGYNRNFVREQFRDEGSTFNMDITYEPSQTVNGNFEGIKLPVPHQGHISTDLRDLGDDKEQYRAPFSLRTGERRDDYRGIIRLAKAMGAPQAEFDATIADALNVDEALRVTALTILSGIGDIYFSSSGGLQHNIRIYTQDDDGPAQFLPWDMDFVSTQPATSGIFPAHNLSKFMNNPNTRRRYFSHLLDLVETVFNADYMTPWLAHYGSVVGQNYTGAASYITSRRNYVLGQLPGSVPFEISTNDGENFGVNTNFFMIGGTGWIDLWELEVNDIPQVVQWSTVTNWSVNVPLAFGTNVLVFQGRDRAGNAPASLRDTIIVTNGLPVILLPVVINEWMADNKGPGGLVDPADGLFQDWFELFNPNVTSVDLGGYHLTDNLSNPTKFTIPTNTVIGARGFLLVWADEDGGQNPPFSPDIHANFRLSNSGETLGLFAPDGLSPQHTVVFGSQLPNVSQGLFPDGAVGNPPSLMPDWSPRAPNRLGEPASPDITGVSIEAGMVTMTLNALPNRTYRMEYKDDLNAALWNPSTTLETSPDGTLVLIFSIDGVPQRFFRVRLEQE